LKQVDIFIIIYHPVPREWVCEALHCLCRLYACYSEIIDWCRCLDIRIMSEEWVFQNSDSIYSYTAWCCLCDHDGTVVYGFPIWSTYDGGSCQ
jgi:hypothetical protein